MKRFIVSYVLFIAMLSGVFWLVGNSFSSANVLDQTIKFKVSSGEGVFSIANNLYSQKIIRSKTIFIAYAVVGGNFSRFQSGNYLIKPSSSIRDIISLLTSGSPDISITIFPGMTLKEADAMLTRDGVINAGDLENIQLATLKKDFPFLSGAGNLEGFLMPDTYRIRPDYKPEEIAKVILNNFNRKTQSIFSSTTDIYRAVIIGSLLEKEVLSQNDKRLVSGIIEKRLKMGMALQIDATVIYAACGGEFLGCKGITQNDYKLNSPYNTYVIVGLPPAPIGNPSVDSIEAALSPIVSQYLYYLTDSKTQQTIFSSTFDQHNDSRAKYLRL
jgi:UPF0755 protein